MASVIKINEADVPQYISGFRFPIKEEYQPKKGAPTANPIKTREVRKEALAWSNWYLASINETPQSPAKESTGVNDRPE